MKQGNPPGERFDAGPVLSETTHQMRHTFSITNTTGRPVNITNVRASCSCTTALLRKRFLNPGEATELELTASVPNSYSRADLFCTLETDNANASEWVYSMHFESLPRVVINPSNLDLGSFKESDLTEGCLPASAIKPINLSVDIFGSDRQVVDGGVSLEHGEGLSARLTPETDGKIMRNGIWHRRYSATVNLREGFKIGSGNQASSLVVKAAGGQSSAMLSWHVEQPIAASPSFIHFGSVRPGGKPVQRRLLLRSTTGKTFRITSTSGGSYLRI